MYALERYSTIWSGVVAVGGSYQQVEGIWSVPQVSGSPHNSDASAWVGLGGDGQDGGCTSSDWLVQAGVDELIDVNGRLSKYAWIYDYYCLDANQSYFINISDVYGWYPNYGDTIDADVSSNFDCAGKPYYYIGDATNGQYFGECEYWPPANGTTAEWIVEKAQPYLANFGNLEFSNDDVTRGGTFYFIGQLPANLLYSKRLYSAPPPSGVSLAYPSPIHDGTYFWIHCSMTPCQST